MTEGSMSGLESSLIWKRVDDALIAEAVGYCCVPLYAISKVDDAFVVDAKWAAPGDPIRADTAFETIDAAKAAAYAAWDRFRRTKFWDVIACDDCYLEEKRKRHHEPGCEYTSAP
jgi:hypothetical protein